VFGISNLLNGPVSKVNFIPYGIPIINNRVFALVDKMEQMLGSYGPSPTGEPYIKNFEAEESPSGMVARSGSYTVRSRVVDDDGEVYAGTRSRHIRRLQADFVSLRLGVGFQADKGVVSIWSVLYNHMYQDAGIYMFCSLVKQSWLCQQQVCII
jgi:hypothetical protein